MHKNKLSIREQITHMKEVQGIKFNIVNENQAEEFLKNNGGLPVKWTILS